MADEEVQGEVATVESPTTETGDKGAQAAPESQSQSGAQSTGEDTFDAKKTYTSKEVSQIVQTRVNKLNAEKAKIEAEAKAFKAFGSPDQIAERTKRLEQLESQLRTLQNPQGQGQDKPEDPNEKAFKDYLFKLIPGLQYMPNVMQQMQSIQANHIQTVIQAGKSEIVKLAQEAGIKEQAQVDWLENVVAASLKANDEDRMKFLTTGDMKILQAHFKQVKESLLDPILKRSAAQYSATKDKTTKSLPPQMPKGGVPAQTSKDNKKLSAEERAHKAYELYQAALAQSGGE